MKPTERHRQAWGSLGVVCLLMAGMSLAALVHEVLQAGTSSPLTLAFYVFCIAAYTAVGKMARYLWRPREYYQACRRDLIREHQRLRRYAASNHAGFQALHEAMDRLAESGR